MGASGMGHYSSVLNVFMPFFSLATAGITPAVSRFTAQLNAQEDQNGIYRLLCKAMKLYISIAVAASCIYFVFSKTYSQYIGDDIFFTGAVVLLPCIAMAAAEMVFKGVTQGKMKMHITAAANVTESFVKTVLGITLVWYVMYRAEQKNENMPVLACLAAVTISSFVCFVFLVLTGREKRISRNAENTTIPHNPAISSKQLLSMSVPIAASAVVASLVSFFDTAVCLPMIKSIPYSAITQSFEKASFMGAEDIAMYLFGIWQGMALTVFNLVPAVLASVGTACLPVLTRAQGFKDKTYLNRQTEKLFKITAFFSIPAAVFVFIFRREIVVFLFGISPQQAQIASRLLAIVIPFCPFACFVSALNSVIHAHGKSAAVFKILVAASAVKCAVSAVGCAMPSVNIKALAVSAAAFYTVIFVLSVLYTAKLGVRIGFAKTLVPPLAAAMLTAFAVNIFKAGILYCLPLFVQLLLGGTVFCTGYILVVFATGFTVDI